MCTLNPGRLPGADDGEGGWRPGDRRSDPGYGPAASFVQNVTRSPSCTCLGPPKRAVDGAKSGSPAVATGEDGVP